MSDMAADDPVDVLLVEDDDGDALIISEAFEYYRIRNHLHVVTDGELALRFLRGEAPYQDKRRPGLVLLDVHLPRVSGLDLLGAIAADPDLATVPVVMLTSSPAEADILRGHAPRASAYVSKPVDFEHFIEAIRQIDDFFLTLVRLPRLKN